MYLPPNFPGQSGIQPAMNIPKKNMEKFPRKKSRSKFESVARAIESVQPRFWLPSAGPPCFLDPTLIPFEL